MVSIFWQVIALQKYNIFFFLLSIFFLGFRKALILDTNAVN